MTEMETSEATQGKKNTTRTIIIIVVIIVVLLFLLCICAPMLLGPSVSEVFENVVLTMTP